MLVQWRNSWGSGGGGAEYPDISHKEISADLGIERQGKKGNGQENKENPKMEGGKFKWKEDHFSKPLNMFLGLPKWEFSNRKKHFMPGKNSGKITLPPLKNIPLMPLCCDH